MDVLAIIKRGKYMEYKINDIIVEFIGIDNVTEDVAKKYLKYVNEYKENQDAEIEKITISVEGNEANIDISYVQNKEPIERIRRITGYLTTATNAWNNSKRNEESERVKHL